MNKKVEEKKFSVVVLALDYKITNTNTVHPLNMSRFGCSLIKDNGKSFFFFPLYILTVKPRGGRENLGRDLLREIGISKENPVF